MNKLKYILPLLTLFLFLQFASGYCQSHKDITPEMFGAELDSLNSYKMKLLSEKEKLNAEIDSLKVYIPKLDAKVNDACEKLYINKYGREIGSRVAMGQVWKGMTKKMLRDSWGKPDKTHTDRYNYGVFEQWYYGEITYFFRDGKLIDWEDNGKK